MLGTMKMVETMKMMGTLVMVAIMGTFLHFRYVGTCLSNPGQKEQMYVVWEFWNGQSEKKTGYMCTAAINLRRDAQWVK